MSEKIPRGELLLNYLKSIQAHIYLSVFLCVSYNLYFVLLLPVVKLPFLSYLNLLVATVLMIWGAAGYLSFVKKQRVSEEEIRRNAMEEQLKEQFALNCDLQDYITKWCHEVKIPLAASLLMSEKIEDGRLRQDMREQLERMNSLLKNALLGCKVQSTLFDLQIHRVKLLECVRMAVHNNQFFLIQGHFELDISVEEVQVYTDKSWLVYVLDQLISNAVKYAGENARLKIWSRTVKAAEASGAVKLYVQDFGAGIREGELRRIFEKGFTGSNYHNGQYKSTGMGLYMAKVILDRLGHGIEAESVYGEYTRFTITFSDSREFFFQ